MRVTADRHRAVIEAGPATIRRICCGTSGAAADDDLSEVIREALGAIDDRVALVGGRPVTVDSLWCAALRSVKCANSDGLILLHPSWWPPARVAVVRAAAETMADDVLLRRRSWLLAQASEPGCESVVVEIAERLVAITGAEVVAIPLEAEPHSVVEEAASVIARMTPQSSAAVVIDAPGTVAAARALGASIARALLRGGLAAVEIGDAQLPGLAQSALPAAGDQTGPRVTADGDRPRSRARVKSALAGSAVALAAFPPAFAAVAPAAHRGVSPPVAVQAAPTTFLVEGRVALTVPANWPAQRVVTGPGSARVQMTSPSDPEVALHVTQSPVAGETLSGTAERLKRAIDVEPAGVFVDFNPAGASVGRPAVTYREVRATHHVRWTVLLDGPIRISVGCQSRPGDEAAVRDACEQAVRSAHAIG